MGVPRAVVYLEAQIYCDFHFTTREEFIADLSSILVTSTAIGFVLARYPHHRFLTICSLAVMTLGSICMMGLSQQTPLLLQEIYISIAALGMGPLWTLTLLMIQASVAKEELAIATTGFGLVRSLSGALGGRRNESSIFRCKC